MTAGQITVLVILFLEFIACCILFLIIRKRTIKQYKAEMERLDKEYELERKALEAFQAQEMRMYEEAMKRINK